MPEQPLEPFGDAAALLAFLADHPLDECLDCPDLGVAPLDGPLEGWFDGTCQRVDAFEDGLQCYEIRVEARGFSRCIFEAVDEVAEVQDALDCLTSNLGEAVSSGVDRHCV